MKSLAMLVVIAFSTLASGYYRPARNDRAAPSIVLTAPLPGVLVYGQVTLTASTSDNVGVTRVLFQADGVTACDQTGTPAKSALWNCSWDSVLDMQTTRTLTATAYDAAGNHRSASLSVTSAARLRIVTTSLPPATCGKPYRAVLETSGAIPGTIVWKLDLGPSWLTLSQEGDLGILSGMVPAQGLTGECLAAQALPGAILAQLRSQF